MDTPLIVSFAHGLAQAGYSTVRFNFLYAQEGRKAPDRQDLLLELPPFKPDTHTTKNKL
jgi:predicted alpha/beta-hydrolase family hydrolase